MQQGLISFFNEYVDKRIVFRNKKTLQSQYFPSGVLHRDSQLNQIANILAPALKFDRPSNLFIYGRPGSGKTVCMKHITSEMQKVANSKNIPFRAIYINCKLGKVADTEYRLIAEIARELGKVVPSTGLPTEEVYNLFLQGVKEKPQILLLVLDEIDHLVKKIGDEILYNLTRINDDLKESIVAIAGISNDVVFVEGLDPRVKSSLSQEEVTFPPYNAMQIQDILIVRADLAFEADILDVGVIEKCAAYAARDHGDLRRALDLLRVAGEIAERNNLSKVTISDLDLAEAKLEKDRLFEMIMHQPRQYQVVLYSILSIGSAKLSSGDVYEAYRKLADRLSLPTLTSRRVSDIIADFDSSGILTAKIISKGRYGRSRELSLAIPNHLIPKIKKTIEDGIL